MTGNAMSEPQDTSGTPGTTGRGSASDAAGSQHREREQQRDQSRRGLPRREPHSDQGRRAERARPGAVSESVAYSLPGRGTGPLAPTLIAKLGAEAFGAFVLVLSGLGVALYAGFTGLGGGPLAVALGFGLGYLAAAIAVGHVSGAHFNPAVTLGAAIAQRISWRDLVPYWIAQLVGSAFAAAILFVAIATFPALEGAERTFFATVANGFGEHSPIAAVSGAAGEGFGLWGALLIECVVAAVFVGVALGSTDRRSNRALAPFSIGFALAVMLLVSIPVTNGSVNPARSTAAAIFSEGWAFGQLWVFWVAPLVGAAIAAVVYRAFAPEPSEEGLQPQDEDEDDDEVVVVEETVTSTGTSDAGPGRAGGAATGGTGGEGGTGGTGGTGPKPPETPQA